MMLRFILIFYLALAGTTQYSGANTRLLIFAAASMKNVLEDIAHNFELQCQCEITFSFASSGTLAKQIEAGAPADIFISADRNWMDWLIDNASIHKETVQIIAGNRLVIATSKNSPEDNMEDDNPEKVSRLLNSGRIAMAETRSVPAGRYAKQALDNLQLWQEISKKVVYGENVRVTLSMVARQDVSAAIVYFTDAKIEPRVKIAYTFEEGSHDKILYPSALVINTVKANEFMAFLKTKTAQKTFAHHGFKAIHDDR